ncbi:MAG TPA: DUF58 domain-containing protein [Stenomitos sp.]
MTVSTTAAAATQNRFIPTARLYVWLGLGFLIPLGLSWMPGSRVEVQWAMMGLYDAIILAIASWDYRQALQWQIELTRSCEAKLSIGRENAIELGLQVLAHPANTRSTALQLQDGIPTEFRCDTDVLSIQDLSSEQPIQLTYRLWPPRRGHFSWTSAHLRLPSPWGLVLRQWQVSANTEVEVYPDLIGLRQLSIRLSLDATGNLQRRHRVGGTEFAELREYTVGDDVRLINWKATARRQQPIVRVLEPEREQPLLILLDQGRLMTAQVAGLSRFDWALNATLSLALAGLRRGDQVGVAVFDKTIQHWIAPQPGLSHLSRLMDVLHALEPNRSESDYSGVAAQILNQYTRRALVVVLTDIVDEIASEDLLMAMGRLSPRFLPFCVALRDPQVDAQAHRPLEMAPTPPSNAVQQLYTQAVALDLLHQRRLAFAKLQAQGSLVLDAPAPLVSEALVAQYLRTKMRGRL